MVTLIAVSVLHENRLPTSNAQDASRLIAIQDVTVVPMDRERLLPAQTVLIENERIIGIGPARKMLIPAGAHRILATHLYLLPGLMDLHIHFQSGRKINERLLTLFVANGVTTVLNMRGEPDYLKLRADVAAQKLLGPAIYSTGPFLGDTPGKPLRTTPAQIKARIAEDRAMGYNFVKLHGDLSPAAYKQLLLSANTQGLRVVGHVPRNLGVEAALAGRQSAIAHGEEYLYSYFYFHRPDGDRDEPIPELDARTKAIAVKTATANVSVMPNLDLFKQIAIQAEDLNPLLRRKEVEYLSDAIRKQWWQDNNDYPSRFKGRSLYFRKRYRILQKLTKALQNAGARLLIGTDTPTPCVVPGFSVRDELQDLVDSGLTPYQALRAATANGGEFLRIKSGTISAGQRADLLLLRANPLTDVRNVAQLAGVILRGRWMPAQELQSMLQRQSAGDP